jgi:hypothetical protein
MKRVVFLTVAALFAASMVFAQQGSIGIFSDMAGTNCNLRDVAPAGLTEYYVVQINTVGSSACAFAAPKPTCLMATYLSDGNVFPLSLGDSQTLKSVGYGECLVGSIHVLTLKYFTMGMTQPCCPYLITAGISPSGQIETVDCGGGLNFVTGGQGIVNSNPTCICTVVPVKDTTWGGVKALYE